VGGWAGGRVGGRGGGGTCLEAGDHDVLERVDASVGDLLGLPPPVFSDGWESERE
jgi:hypothetical protein